MNQSSHDDLSSDLRAYVVGRRDSKRESELLLRLRALPQQRRRELLLPLLELKRRAVLVLIHRAQLSRSDYLEVLKRGLSETESESIVAWMDATVSHIGWHKTFSVLRETMATNPRGGAMALYQVPRVCRGKGQLSGSLPTRDLVVEYLQLIELYHEKGHCVVPETALDRFKEALWDHNFDKHDSGDCVFVEFKLSWEDWQESRQIRETGRKALDQYQSDYLSFGAETRQFKANEFGWTYKNSSGIARHEWEELFAVVYQNRVIILMTTGCQYALSLSALNEAQLAKLMRWLERAMHESG